jgi:hypothetical protein
VPPRCNGCWTPSWLNRCRRRARQRVGRCAAVGAQQRVAPGLAHPPAGLSGPHRRDISRRNDADIDGLVFATLAPQPWEPYAAGGDWRAALEAWYRDRLAVHDRQHRHHQERSAAPRPFRPPTDTEFTALMACRQADTAALLVIGDERKRDRIEASYRPGLAAGGDDRDWIGWYRQRIIDTWDQRDDEIHAHCLLFCSREYKLLTPGGLGIPMLEVTTTKALPDYWRAGAPHAHHPASAADD